MLNGYPMNLSEGVADRLERHGELKYRVKQLIAHQLFQIPLDKGHPVWSSEDPNCESRLESLRFDIEHLFCELSTICDDLDI